MGRRVHEHERNGLPGRDRKLAHGCQPLASKFHGRSQDEHVGTGNREKIPGICPSHPRNGGSVVEADDQLGLHRHGAALANNQTHQVRHSIAHGQEVDQRGLAPRRDEVGLEDQRIGPVAARNPNIAVSRRDAPPSVAGVPEKSGKTGAGVKARPTQPVDRAAFGYECGRLAIADHSVVLNADGHGA
jgi:hypothetical protein